MAVRVLKGAQQIQDFLKSNPGAFDPSKLENNSGTDYMSFAKQQAQAQQEANYSPGITGFFERLGTSLTQGPRAFGVGVPGANNTDQSLLPTEQLRLRQDPNTFRAQAAINTASFLPIIANPVIGGFVSGAAQNFAGQDLGDKGIGATNIGDVIGSGLLGAGTGFVASKAANLLGKGIGKVVPQEAKDFLNRDVTSFFGDKGGQAAQDIATPITQEQGPIGKLGKKIEEYPVKIKADKSPLGAENAANVKSDYIDILKGQKINDFGGKGMAQAYKNLDTQFDDVASKITRPIDLSNIADDYGNELSQVGVEVGTKGTKYADAALQKALSNPTVKNITSIVKDLDGGLGNAYKAIETGTRQLSDPELSQIAARSVLRSYLGNQVPELEPIYNQLATLHSASGDVINTFNKSGYLSLPLALGGVKIPTGGIPGKVVSGLGRGLQSLDKLNIKLPSLGINGTQPFVAGLSSIGVPGKVQPAQSQGYGDYSLKQQPSTSTQSITPIQALDAAIKANGGKMNSVTLSLADYILKSSAGGGAKLPVAGIKDLQDSSTGLNQLSQLEQAFEQSKQYFDPITGPLRNLNPYDAGSKSVQAIIALAKQIIGKGLEGGVLRKEDESKYAAILPQLSDTPETVQNKIKGIQQALVEKYNQTVDLYGNAGYDISNYGYFQ